VTNRLFPALLKYWRGRRGLSQLDLSVESGVTARHLSFLESGRSKPSEEMVLRLMSLLRVPLRDKNQALRAAGFEPQFDEPPVGEPPVDEFSSEVNAALDQMLKQHEPYPMTVVAMDGAIVRMNAAGRRRRRGQQRPGHVVRRHHAHESCGTPDVREAVRSGSC
jgi:transcriptional regulator with XRE-family HTH domain